MLPDPGFLYLSKKHQMALTMLEYALYNNAGFCIISGEIGAGKTTLLRKLLESIEDHISVGMITNTHSSFGELLDWVLSAFNIHQPGMNKVEMHQIFLEYLLQQYSKKKTVVLIVDEAQNMSVDTLEELRMLSNINTGKDQLLQVILAGQPELKDTLRLPQLKQFAQRIAVDYHLGALSIEDTFGYIRHRLKTAGATRDIFSPLACERIHQYSGGVPRLINLLCDTSMVYGFADQAKVIDENLVDEMVRERMSDSLVPIVRPEDSATESPDPSATSSEPAARGKTQASSKLSQISPEQKKQPVSPTSEKKTVADIRQPAAVHSQAQAYGAGARLKAVAAHPEPDLEEQEEAVHETARANEPEVAPETHPESAVEPEADAGPETEASTERAETAERADTSASPSQPTQPETVKQRLENRIEVLKVVAAESENNWFGNRWTMAALLILGISVIFLLVRSMSSDSTSLPVKTEASVVSSPKTAPVAASTSTPDTATATQPAADNSATTARQQAIEAARKAAEQREAEASARREQEAAAAAKAKAEAEARAKAEAAARAAAEAKAKAEQEKRERLKQAAAARKAAREQAAAKARAAELEAKLKAEQAAAARARQQAAEAEEKARQAQAQALELQQKTQASPAAAPAATTDTVAASAKPASNNAQEVDPELEFTTDPCQGPSAKFLSTCRK